MSAQDFVIGVETEIYFGIMPAELLALETLTPPPNVLLTTSGAATQGAAVIPVTALTKPVAAGSVLKFAPATLVTVTEPATANATSLTSTALGGAIPDNATIHFFEAGFSVQTSAAAASAATAVSVDPLPVALPDNAVGYYFSAAPKFAYITQHAKTGDTQLVVEPLAAALTSGDIALHYGLLLLEGGTTSDEQIQAKDTESQVYGKGLKYATGKVTGASWQVSYSFNVLPSDPGYFRLAYAAQNAIAGIRGWVKKVDPVPAGYTEGESIQGLADVTDFSKSNPAEGVITGKQLCPAL
jgi:hypothetical protein